MDCYKDISAAATVLGKEKGMQEKKHSVAV
jgi:hypothetical protein